MALGTGVNVSSYEGCALLMWNPGVQVSSYEGAALLIWNTGVQVSSYEGSALLVPVYTNPPVWQPLTFSNGVVGTPYSQSGAWCTGTSPITYTLNSGSLPPGLSLSSSGVTGTLSGTPTTIGLYAFTLLATNAYGSAVSPTLTIRISLPSTGNSAFNWVA